MTQRPGDRARGAAPAVQHGRSFLRRLAAAWRAMAPDQRLAAGAATGLFVTMFLPWYSKSVIGVQGGMPVKSQTNLSAFQAFSFVEAAVLLVAVGVLSLLFFRAEGRAFHLPGGDGAVVLAAGVWVCMLIFYRQLDKPNPGAAAGTIPTIGVEWGIFATFLAGLALAYAGNKVRSAHHAEPPLPGDEEPTIAGPTERIVARPD